MVDRRKARDESTFMEVHVRELFAGKWMEDQSSPVDVVTTIENGRSVGIVRVDLQSTLTDLRNSLKRQIDRERVPRAFAFVERLGKQLVEVWEDEETLLRVKDLVGREPEILIVELPDRKKARKPSEDTKEAEAFPEKDKTARNRRKEKLDKRIRSNSERPRWSDPEEPEENPDARFKDDETRLYSSGEYRRNDPETTSKRSQKRWRGLRRDIRSRSNIDNTEPASDEGRGPNRRLSQSRRRRSRNHRAKSGQNRLASDEENPRNRRRQVVRRGSQSIENNRDSAEERDEPPESKMERERPGTVRIRKEHRLTEELRMRDNGNGRGKPTRRNSTLRRSISVDDLRSATSSESNYNGYRTADSGAMDDYFLDRPTLTYSALNLRDLEKDPIMYRRRFEPMKMERRIAGLLNRIRGIEDKTALLRSIGQEQWRGRFFQLRRNTQPLEERVRELEDEEADVEENLIRLFELRKPMRYGIYGDYLKNNYVLQAQKLQSEINQLNTQLENIDLDLLKYRKMRKLTENQTETLARDIQREKFVRHLLLGRTLGA